MTKLVVVFLEATGVEKDVDTGARMTLTVHTPAKAAGPGPLLLNVSFGFGAGKAPRPGTLDLAGEALGRGRGYATLGYTDIQPDGADRWTEGVIGKADWNEPHRQQVVVGIRAAGRRTLQRRGVLPEDPELITARVTGRAALTFANWPVLAAWPGRFGGWV